MPSFQWPRATRSTTRAALVLSLLGGCGGAPDFVATENIDEALVTSQTFRDTEVDVGFGIKRPMHIEFGTKCVEWGRKVLHKGSLPEPYCVKMALDDTVWQTAKIYKDTAGKNTDTIFPAARSCGFECVRWETKPAPKGYGPTVRFCAASRPGCITSPYEGCGPAAAANVLNFYGIELSTTEVANQYVATFPLPFSDQIATTPDALADGLQKLLDKKADGVFTVRRKSYVDIRSEIQAAIRGGNPIVVLVNSGMHYVMITGYEDWSTYRVTDYTGSERKVAEWDLGTDVVTGDLGGWAGGYLPDTVVTVERRPR